MYQAGANMTMMDLVINACGSLQAAMQFCQDNNVALSDVPVAGTMYIVSAAALAQAGSAGVSVLTTYKANGYYAANLGDYEALTDTDGEDLTDSDGSLLTD